MSLKVLCVCATSALHGQQCRQVQRAVLPPLKKGKKDNGAAAPAQHPSHRLRVGMGLNLCCLAHTLIEIPLRAPAVYSEPGWCPP